MALALRYLTRASALGIVLGLQGCDALTAGVCSHSYRDPLLTIVSAADSASGAPVARLALYEFSLDGQPVSVRGLVQTPPASRVSENGDSLICEVSCGFGSNEGAWMFTASAPGYRARVIQLSARYPRFDGGCPSSNSGSVAVRVRLEQQ